MTGLFDLGGKVAIVTGAAGLLGPRHCSALAAAGARVVATDIEQGRLDQLASELGADAPALAIAADITDPAALDELRERVLRDLGHIDVLVNNAAIDDKVEKPAFGAADSRFEAFPIEKWRRTLDVNVTGVFLSCQRLGAPMAEQGRGSIINIASTYGVVAPDQSLYVRPDGTRLFYKGGAYPTSKGAVIAFTRYLAAYWGDRGVRVNTLSPGGVSNGQEAWFDAAYSSRTMLGRMAAPTDYQGALVFLACDASAYLTGANLVVDGGFTSW